MSRRAGPKAFVAEYLASLPPCSVVATRDVGKAILLEHPSVGEHVIREALQALAVGSPRPDSKRGPTYSAVQVSLPELLLLGQADGLAYLAIPPIERHSIGLGARGATEDIQRRWSELLGKPVVDFWLKQTQLQGMSFAKKARREVMRRDGDRCRLCCHLEKSGATSLEGGLAMHVDLRAAHLTKRSDSFWRILGGLLPAHAADPEWIFTSEGAETLVDALKADEKHSGADYLVCLCRRHDEAVQAVLYPRAKPAL